jgi:type VI secretion system protein ImpK
MSTAILEKPSAASRRRARSISDLVSLATPALELVLKLQAGLVLPSNDLRPAFEQMLEDLEQRGRTLRFGDKQLQDVKFALAAFIDETILTNNFPLREEWEKVPLQLQYFGEHLAGIKFFERLDDLKKHAEAEADTLEVYYLCLLLGFKGKHKVYMEEELKGVIAGVANELTRVGRLQQSELSPHWRADDQPEPPPDTGLPLWVKVGAGIGLGVVVLIYIALNFLIRSDLNAAKEQLLR